MYTCSVCGNSSYKTKYTRPELVYHRFPKKENLRKIWLEVLGIDHYSSIWQCVCSDHFLEENYRPGIKMRKLLPNTIPQPHDQKSDQNGFPNNYTIQINDVETGNNAVLPMEQNIIIKEGNTVVNNFKAQQRSGRKMKSTRVNDDMNNSEYLPRPKIEKWQIPAVIETDVRPVLTATKVFEPQCCIQGCISNITNTDEGPYHFSPTKECVNKWSSALGLQLNVNCCICERHFRPQDFTCEEILVDGLKKVVKLLVNSALPIPINAVVLASNARNNLQDNTDKCSKSNTSMTIDDFPNIDFDLKQKLKNISAKNSLSITLESTSTLKMQDKLLSNTVICPEFIDNQTTFLKCISPKNKANSSELLEIMSPLVTKSEGKSDMNDSNSDFRTHTLQCEIIDHGNTKEFKEEDGGFIFEVSKRVTLPSLFWNITHLEKQNTTAFYYQSFFENTEKKINFSNSLVPVVQLYGKIYEYNKPIKSKHELENLLEKIDGFEKCSGGLYYQKCIGYFDGSSEDTKMCSACQEWETNQDLQKIKISETIKCFESKIAKRKSVVMKLREKMKKEKETHLEN